MGGHRRASAMDLLSPEGGAESSISRLAPATRMAGSRARLARMGPTRVTLVPHTHWDREWYQPFEAFLERLVAMMDGLIDVLDAGFPHFHLDGQTALIDDYLTERPERAPDVDRLTRAGKISAGPWFTQMDEFLVSGESHIRNLERGLARAEQLGG